MREKLIQTYLKNLGYYSGSIDGIIGNLSKAAINEWKRSQRLVPEDGVIYPAEFVLLQIEAAEKGSGIIPFSGLVEYKADRINISPNRSVRKSSELKLIVLHATAGTDKGDESWLTSTKSEASAHLLIRRDGTTTRLVHDKDRAWHAGISSYEQQKSVNDFSLGIEIGNLNDGKEKYREEQYKKVAEILKHYINQGLSKSRIVSHAAIAPTRKNDPLDWDWEKMWKLVNGY